jgi:REP element-mobilizing transposase RayT
MKIPYVQHDLHGNCTSARWRHFQCGHCGTVHDFLLRCNKRFEVQCPDCSGAWRRKVISKFKRGIANMKTPKFVTLTLKKGETLDLHKIWNMRNYLFRVLRRRGYRIDGWLAVCEYPNHIHLIMDSSYIPQHELSETWLSATGDSFIVDIRPVLDDTGRRKSVNYLSKYLGKSQGWEDANLSLLKGFHLQNNHGLNLEKPGHVCPCDCGIGPLRIVSDDEFEHYQSHEIDLD